MSRFTGIILAAGYGRRMNSTIAKQYMLLEGKPVLYYAIQAFQESDIDDIVLVVGEGEEDYVNDLLLKPYGFTKVKKVVVGGKERYHSVYHGLCSIEHSDYVLVHDGARPFITKDLIHRIMKEVQLSHACVVGVPTKDTVKILDAFGYVVETPKRDCVWSTQTPQAFSYHLLKQAYDKLSLSQVSNVTDDAMVVELMTEHPIRMLQGDYKNIKITTPEDLLLASEFLNSLDMDKIT